MASIHGDGVRRRLALRFVFLLRAASMVMELPFSIFLATSAFMCLKKLLLFATHLFLLMLIVCDLLVMCFSIFFATHVFLLMLTVCVVMLLLRCICIIFTCCCLRPMSLMAI